MHSSFDQTNNWYTLWMQQSKVFFETADQYFKNSFEKDGGLDPKQHLEKIHAWLETLKRQWEIHCYAEKQKMYWDTILKLYNETSELMINEWIRRSKDENPIQSTRDLYELWLACCTETYQKAMNSKDFQSVFGDWMNAAINFWVKA